MHLNQDWLVLGWLGFVSSLMCGLFEMVGCWMEDGKQISIAKRVKQSEEQKKREI